jgi:hypothetical protein
MRLFHAFFASRPGNGMREAADRRVRQAEDGPSSRPRGYMPRRNIEMGTIKRSKRSKTLRRSRHVRSLVLTQPKRPRGFPKGRHATGRDTGNDALIWARRARALDLRIEGYYYAQIAERLRAEGFPCSIMTAHKDVQKALRRLQEYELQKAARLKTLEFARLEEQTRALWDRRSDPSIARALVAISQRRSKLAGLDAPLEIASSDSAEDDVLSCLPDDLLQQVVDCLDARKVNTPLDAEGYSSPEQAEIPANYSRPSPLLCGKE